jgi:hypothetical protein
MQFIAPVDMYSNNNTTEYNKYLLFPKYNIIDSLPQVGNTTLLVHWINDYSEFVNWVNDNTETVNWVATS